MLIRATLSIVTILAVNTISRAADPVKPLFEQGVVAAVEGENVWNCLPNVARMANGELLAVWSTSGRAWGNDLHLLSSVSHDSGRTWTKGTKLASEPKTLNCDASLLVDGDTVLLFWSLVRNPNKIDNLETWKTVSTDFGHSWSKATRVPMPHKYSGSQSHSSLKLADGALVLPYAWDMWVEEGLIPKTEGEMKLKASLLTSRDHGATWQPGGDVFVDAPHATPFSISGACEPGIVQLADGSLFMLARTGTTHSWETRSRDGGKTWDAPKPSPLTAHNTPTALRRLAGDGAVIATWCNSPRNRWPLVVAVSTDGCRTWSQAHELGGKAETEASYPSIAELDDGTIVVVWQQDLTKNVSREIRYARFNRTWLAGK